MKDAIIVALILAAVLLGFGQSREPEAQIQDTTLHHADYRRCVTIPTGPLQPHTSSAIIYPRRSDMA